MGSLIFLPHSCIPDRIGSFESEKRSGWALRLCVFSVSLLFLSACGDSGTGYTRLMRAAASGEAHSVETFLGEGEDPDARDASGNSALSLAAQFGREAIVTMLLEGGARADLPDDGGTTPLMKAARFGHDEVVEALLEGGADPARRDGSGRTAADWAKESGHEELAARLERTSE